MSVVVVAVARRSDAPDSRSWRAVAALVGLLSCSLASFCLRRVVPTAAALSLVEARLR